MVLDIPEVKNEILQIEDILHRVTNCLHVIAIVLANIHQLHFAEILKTTVGNNIINEKGEIKGEMSSVILREVSSSNSSGSENESGSSSQDEEIPIVQNAQQDNGDQETQQQAPPQQNVASSDVPVPTVNVVVTETRRVEPSIRPATDTSSTRSTRVAVQAVPAPPASLLPLAAGTWLMYVRLQWPYLARAYDLYTLWVTMIQPNNIDDRDQNASFVKASVAQAAVTRDTEVFNNFLMFVRHYGFVSEDERLRLIPAPVSGFYRGPFALVNRDWTMSDVFGLVIMNNTIEARTFVSVCEYGNLLFGWRMANVQLIKPAPMEMFVFFARRDGLYPAWMQSVMDEVMRPSRGARRRDRHYEEGEETDEPLMKMHRAVREESEDTEEVDEEEYEDDDEDE